MKQPDLRSLSRGELLEILVQQGEELERLRSQNEQLQQQLQDRSLKLQEAGSIAEAALKVSGVFEAAQEAAEQYLQNVRQITEREHGSALQAQELLAQTQAQCAAMKVKTEQQCEKMLEKAKRESLAYWAKVSRKLDGLR